VAQGLFHCMPTLREYLRTEKSLTPVDQSMPRSWNWQKAKYLASTNRVIEVGMNKVFETDWLGSAPLFYNVKTGKVSHNINNVIEFADLEFDPEGFNNYLDFGYSILEQTPVRHVKFLRHSARLSFDDNGKINVDYLDDPTDRWLDLRLSESDIFDLLQSRIRNWEHSCSGEIIITTSGGYDTRLLNLMIEDKSRVRSFTYGISEKQSDSFEVVYAKRLSELLGTRWEQIPLGDLFLYFEDWDKLFGVSTHAHGMYHIEFYKKILPKVSGGNPFLSGIIGDIWAGNWNIPPIDNPGDLKHLGRTYGMNADSTMSQLKSKRFMLEDYFSCYTERLQDPRLRIIEAVRFKIILLSYLMTVPSSFGFKPWSPFPDIEVAMAMLMLPQERRQNRIWQREFFQKQGVDFESMNIKVDMANTLSQQAMRRIHLKPLDSKLLLEVVKSEYVEWINRQVRQQGILWEWFWKLANSPRIGKPMRMFGVKEQRLQALSAYLTLKPIESLLLKRDACRDKKQNPLIKESRF